MTLLTAKPGSGSQVTQPDNSVAQQVAIVAGGTTVGVGGPIAEAATLTITLGGTRQSVFAANAVRKSLGFSNDSDTAMTVRFAANAAAGVGIYCAPNGGGFILEGPSCPTDTVDVYCATTGKAFYAWST